MSRWIKLYTEILNDADMGLLTDSAWRLCIELFLLADESGTGELPPRDKIRWALRKTDAAQFTADMDALVQAGIISEDTGTPFVVNFAKRQQADSAAARSKRYHNARKERDDDATNTRRERDASATENYRLREIDSDSERERESDSDSEEKSINPLFSLYQSKIGEVTDRVKRQISDLCKAHGTNNVMLAIETAGRAEKRANLGYVIGILKNWRDEGYPSQAAPKQQQQPIPSAVPTDWNDKYQRERQQAIEARRNGRMQ